MQSRVGLHQTQRAHRAHLSCRGRCIRLPPAMVFTGIVQGTAEVTDVDTKDRFSAVKIKFPSGKIDTLKVGSSVAINGTCLTVTEIQKDTLGFDIMMETLRATNLGELGAGSVVNFERAAKLGDEIGGHSVSGHVHTTATITNVEVSPNNRRVTMTLPEEQWMKYILPKGYVAVDGTSLTVGEVGERSFSVYLIPETLRSTVFGIKSVGDTVNIEVETQTQAVVDTVERLMAQYLGKLGLPVNGDSAGSLVPGAAPSSKQAAAAAAVAAQQQQQQQEAAAVAAAQQRAALAAVAAAAAQQAVQELLNSQAHEAKAGAMAANPVVPRPALGPSPGSSAPPPPLPLPTAAAPTVSPASQPASAAISEAQAEHADSNGVVAAS
ncbi:hypothetical protein V8C86DRAFT_1824296 [Haematococcus lacustris]